MKITYYCRSLLWTNRLRWCTITFIFCFSCLSITERLVWVSCNDTLKAKFDFWGHDDKEVFLCMDIRQYLLDYPFASFCLIVPYVPLCASLCLICLHVLTFFNLYLRVSTCIYNRCCAYLYWFTNMIPYVTLWSFFVNICLKISACAYVCLQCAPLLLYNSMHVLRVF